jgi:hypothetical protein
VRLRNVLVKTNNTGLVQSLNRAYAASYDENHAPAVDENVYSLGGIMENWRGKVTQRGDGIQGIETSTGRAQRRTSYVT